MRPAKRIHLWIIVAVLIAGTFLQAQRDALTEEHPYLGITLVKRSISTPRTVNMRILKIDLAARGIGFKLSPPGGSKEAVNQTTLNYLIQEKAQFAVNAHFYLPVGAPEADLIGLAASNGIVYSAFEAPVQSYAIVDYAPGINIGPDNSAGIVRVDLNYPDKKHVLENVRLWNAFSGSAQIVTNGIKTIPVYKDETHPHGLLTPDNTYSNSHSWYDVLNPRTAIGLSKDNRELIIFIADGRGAGGSLGLTGNEMADLLINDYGVYNALNMDGGGSSTLAMKDAITGANSIINVSPDGASGRAVCSSLAIFAIRENR
jgi:exopolysaccharide biosynthesis protein